MKKYPDQNEPDAPIKAGPGAPTSQTGAISDALRCEIAFWKDLLHRCSQTVPAESVERMRFALELAERKLRDVCDGANVAFRQKGHSGDAAAVDCKIHYLSTDAGSH